MTSFNRETSQFKEASNSRSFYPEPDHEELVVVTNSTPTNELPFSHSEFEQEEEEETQENLFPTKSIPSYPLYSLRSDNGTLSISLSAPSSPRPPPPIAPPSTTRDSPNSANPRMEESKSTDEAEPIHPIMEIIDKQELGKAIIVLAIPMAMALVASSDSLSMKMREVIAVTLSCAFSAIWTGILLRKSYRKESALILIAGIALMMLSLYAYLVCILPVELKWIPFVSCFVSLSPLLTIVQAFCRKKVKVVIGEERDIEKGE